MKQETIDKINAMKPGEVLATKNHKLRCLTKADGGGCPKCFFNKRRACRKIICSDTDRKVCFPELKEQSPQTEKNTGRNRKGTAAAGAKSLTSQAVLKKKSKTAAED